MMNDVLFYDVMYDASLEITTLMTLFLFGIYDIHCFQLILLILLFSVSPTLFSVRHIRGSVVVWRLPSADT